MSHLQTIYFNMETHISNGEIIITIKMNTNRDGTPFREFLEKFGSEWDKMRVYESTVSRGTKKVG